MYIVDYTKRICIAGQLMDNEAKLRFGSYRHFHTNELLNGYKTRQLLDEGVTNGPDFEATSSAIDELSDYVTTLETSTDNVWRRQQVGNVQTFMDAKLGQFSVILQSLQLLAANNDLLENNATQQNLSSSIAFRCSDLISTVERLSSIAFQLMTSSRISASAGDLELLIVKQRESEFQGFVFESSKGLNPVYISVPESAGRDNMAGIVAFSIQGTSQLLSGGSGGKVVTPVVVCSMLDAAGEALGITTLDPVTFSMGYDGVMPNDDLNEVALCSFMKTNTDGSFR